jgi:cytochrome c oxidase subunit I+III
VSAALVLGAWGLQLLAQRFNRRNIATAFYAALAGSMALAAGGCAALVAGPLVTELDPTRHVYMAAVWLLVLWTVFHVAIGILMQLYCLARRFFGHLTSTYDIDLTNVTLYWHFALLTVAITVLVIAGFPLVV